MVRRATRSLEGYICLFGHQGAGRAEVLRFLDGQLRKDPQNPRPRLYAGIIRSLGGEAVDDQEWRAAIAGFAREKDVTGEVYATTSLISARCIGRLLCDVETRALLWRTGELGRASGKVDLQQVAEIWGMKVAFAVDDMDGAAAAEARLQALGPPRSAWLRSESLQARAHLAALLLDHERQRTLYRDLLDTLDADDPRRPAAVGGMASAVAHLALRGLENPTAAERLLREAIDLQERAGLPVLSARTGYLAARVQLAILLGPTAESLSLLRSALAAHLARSRSSGPAPMYSRLALAEFLATSDPPRLEEAMEVSQAAVEHAFLTSGDYEKARTLILRSRMSFRLGRFSPGRADGLAALDLAERLRDQQRSMPLRLRYAQSLSFAYQSLAGALTRSGAPGDASALDDSFQVMERLRARGLMETLLFEGAAGEPVQVQPPRLAQVQGELGPSEALLSFQLWQPEPTVDAPYREGSSWVTVITRERVEAFPIPAADDLARRIRAWTGLLERRDGADRMAGARLYGELLRPALAALPPQIDRLIVVPDGPLHRLPFDALSEGPGTPYVAERFALSIEPSAALWLRFRAAPGQPPGRLLVLADSGRAAGRRLGPARLRRGLRCAGPCAARGPGGAGGVLGRRRVAHGAAGVRGLSQGGRPERGVDAPLRHPRGHRRAGSGARGGGARARQRLGGRTARARGDCAAPARGEDGGARRVRDLRRAAVPGRGGDESRPRVLRGRSDRGGGDAGPRAGRRGRRLLLRDVLGAGPRSEHRGRGLGGETRRDPPGGAAGGVGGGGAARGRAGAAARQRAVGGPSAVARGRCAGLRGPGGEPPAAPGPPPSFEQPGLSSDARSAARQEPVRTRVPERSRWSWRGGGGLRRPGNGPGGCESTGIR